MKFKSTFLTALFCVLISGSLIAQTGDLTLDASKYLNDQILGDTGSTGEQLHEFYLVERGKFYLLNGTMEIDFKLTIQGPDQGAILHDNGTPIPPVITSTADAEGNSRGAFTLVNDGELILKNLIMNGRDDADNNNSPIVECITGKKIEFDNIAILDWSRGLRNKAAGSEVIVTNCLFTNTMSSNFSRWGGQPIRIDGQPSKVIFENNTLVNCGRLIGNRGPWLKCYFRYNHNTIVNNMSGAFDMRSDLLCANNIFYNWGFDGYVESEGPDSPGIDPYRWYFTTENDPAGLPLDSVSCWWGRNAFFLEQGIVDFFESVDTIYMDIKFHPNTFVLVKDDADFVVAADWDDEDPGFTSLQDNVAKMTAWTADIYTGAEIYTDWSFDAPRVAWNGETVTWPHTVDLTYSNEKLKTGGEDGYPLGDLNWYPDKLALWEADKDNLISALEARSDSLGLPATGISEMIINSELASSYPNPFSTSLTIEYTVKQSAHVSIDIYNITGQIVNGLVNKHCPAGKYQVQWNGENQNHQNSPMGLYILKFNVGDKSFYQKIIKK